MKLVLCSLIAVLTLASVGCSPLEQQAYKSVVAANAFIKAEKAQHPECATNPSAAICQNFQKATSAKDLLIDAIEQYCSSPDFDAGKPCVKPSGQAGDIAKQQLQSAVANLNQVLTDVKGAVH
jgi:hypothetical protein